MKKLCILIILFGTWSTTSNETTLQILPQQLIKTIWLPEVTVIPEFSESLETYIQLKQIKYPHIVYAQALLETGEFTSTIYKRNNNLFGMKYVKTTKYSRPTVAQGKRYGHAYYADWKSSVDDYLLWQQAVEQYLFLPIQTEEQYFKLLGARYAESPIYVSCLKQIIKKKKIPS